MCSADDSDSGTPRSSFVEKSSAKRIGLEEGGIVMVSAQSGPSLIIIADPRRLRSRR